MTSSTTIRNFIDGAGRDSASGLTFQHASPENSESVHVAQSELIDVVHVVQAMNRAQVDWQKETRELREEQIRKFFERLIETVAGSQPLLAESLAYDIGMPIRNGAARSAPAALEILRESLVEFERRAKTDASRFPSIGNSAVFLGWTDPLLGFCRRVPAILASGNAVCVKPSSRAPRTVAIISEMVTQSMQFAGLPVGLFAVLNGFGAGDENVGEALLKHPGLKTVFWIGSSDSALAARTTALEHGKRFHFVGSGRNPAILFAGFDDGKLETIIEDWAEAIVDPHGFGPFRPSRLFIQESIYKATLEGLAKRLESLKIGNALDAATKVGPLPSREAERFDLQIKLALSETGHLVTGGSRVGLHAQPTLIRDLTNCSTLQGEELAGPWATIASFKYQHEALKYANTSPLGLAGFVLHPDESKAKVVAQKLEVSRVFFSSSIPWPDAVSKNATPVKSSGNAEDGIAAVFSFGEWRSRWFGSTDS